MSVKEMIKKYKWTMLIGSIVILSPILFGLLFWDQLPQEMATHFGETNTPNGWSSKPVAVFGLPVFLLITQWFCLIIMAADPRKKNIGEKMIRIFLWVIPVVSVDVAISIYGIALGKNIDIGMQTNVLIGILFIVLGNYLHKVKQNYSIGLKLPWTLNDEENWNRTHRFGAWVFIIAGIAMCVNGYFKSSAILGVIIAATIAAPVIYSYLLYRKELK